MEFYAEQGHERFETVFRRALKNEPNAGYSGTWGCRGAARRMALGCLPTTSETCRPGPTVDGCPPPSETGERHMHSIVKRGLRGVALLTPVKPVLLRNVRSVVSFTFDDFPASAGKVGMQILHRYEVRATYYVSGGLEGGNKLYTADELRMVMAHGHEIGCHTYDHTAA